MSERQEVDGDPASLPFGQDLSKTLEGSSIGIAREELVPVDQIEQCHRLAAKRMDDVMVVHDLIVTAVRARPTARKRQQVGAAEEHLETVVVEADAQPVSEQA